MRDLSNIANSMAAMGRNGDDMIAHVSSGDVVIPRDVVLENPEFLTKFKKAMKDMGGDYRGHIAGSGFENMNPMTGQPEFFFRGLRSFFRNPGRQIRNIVQSVASIFAPPPLPAAPAPAPLPEVDLGEVEEEFVPTRPDPVQAPAGLFGREVGGQQFGTLTPTQQRSYFATRGAFGGGLGEQEKDYYLNLLQRNLIDQGGQLQNINEALLPVERTYLGREGLPTGETLSFLQALQ